MKTIHKNRRKTEFNKIAAIFKNKNNFYLGKNAIAVYGDSLKNLKQIPNQCISLILTDPPYHSTKKENIVNDTSFKSDDEFLFWMENYFIEWKRILRPNGSIYLFCSSTMSAKLSSLMSKYFNLLSHIVWTKPNDPGFDGWKGKMNKTALRQWYPHSERILFAEPTVEGPLKKVWFGEYLKSQRLKCGLSSKQVSETIGAFGKINHGGAVSNWEAGRNIPSREQYDKICRAFKQTGKIKRMQYYEDLIRPFNVNPNVEFTDVWNYNSVRPYKGKHPAEKPIELLEHCINASTYKHDIVLDCFSGSGSTALASLDLERQSISIEIDLHWFETIKERIKHFELIDIKNLESQKDLMKKTNKINTSTQINLFT